MKTDVIQYCVPSNIKLGVYKLSSANGHYYIGSSGNLRTRYNLHVTQLIAGNHNNKYLQNAFNKHPVNWRFELIESVVDEKELLLVEQKHLEVNFGKPLCVNICSHASKPPKCRGHSLLTKEKMKKPKSESHRLNISAAKKGIKIKPHSPEALLRKSLRHKGIPWSEARRRAENERRRIIQLQRSSSIPELPNT